MDPERRRKLSLGALILGAILLGWDVLYTVLASRGELDSSQLLPYFAAGAVVPAALLAVGLSLQLMGRRAGPARPGNP